MLINTKSTSAVKCSDQTLRSVISNSLLIKKVIYQANNLLRINGMLAIEIGHYQYKRVSNILKKCKFIEFSKEYDYKRNVRCIISTKTGNN